jgi:single-strand DNA-binding protein
MVNRVILVGRLTKDPELRRTQSGKSVASFTVAVNRRFGQQDQADFISCVAWEKTADFLSQYAKKGAMVSVEGRIQTRNYDDVNTGKKVYVTEVVSENVQLLESRSSSAQRPASNSFDSTSGYQPDNNNYNEEDFATGPILDISSDDLPF